MRTSVRALIGERRHEEAWRLLRPLLLAGGRGRRAGISRAASCAAARPSGWAPPTKRQIRLAVLCTYEGAELAAHLQLACQALGIDAELYVAPFGQLEQEVLDPSTGSPASSRRTS